MKKFTITFLVLILVITGLNVFGVVPPIERMITTKNLEVNLEKNIRIVDVRPDIKDYWKGHIPGAVYLNPETLRLSEAGVPGKFIDPNIFYEILENLGIERNSRVIVYSEGNDFRATYLIWAFDYIMHNQALLLVGGFKKWEEEGRPVTQDYPEIKRVNYSLPRSNNIVYRIRADIDYVKENKDKKDVVFLDVRSKDLYTGEKGFWKRLGHIPGAVHHFWQDDLNPDGSWKSKEELLKIYKDLGVTPDKTIIVSCGQGQMSTHTYFTLKYILGFFDVRNYDGSFNEWSNRHELPVDKGEK